METMKRMTIKERRQAQLDRHYKALEALAVALGHEAGRFNGKKLSVALLKLEREAHKGAEDYCNGVIDSDAWDLLQANIEKDVYRLFKVDSIKGFFVNGDPRGCALKIDDGIMRSGSIKGTESRYANVGLMQDWGGYGLLAPEIDGR